MGEIKKQADDSGQPATNTGGRPITVKSYAPVVAYLILSQVMTLRDVAVEGNVVAVRNEAIVFSVFLPTT